MAKAWYDNQVPTMEMGLLSGMPDMSLTAEDKKRALLQALMQGGLGMAAASLGGANTSQAMGRGLLGGADAYGQGLQAPMSRFEMAKKQLEFQGNQLNNAKLLNEYKQGQQQADIFKGAAQNATNGAFDQLGQVNNAYLQNGPQQQPLDNAGGFDQLYAQGLSKNLQSPDTLARFGAAGGDISKLTSYMNAMKPDTIAGGSWQRDQLTGRMSFVPKVADNAMIMPNGEMATLSGAEETLNKLQYAGKAGELAAQLGYDRAKLPYDVQRAGQVASAEEGARFPYKTESFYNPETRQTGTRFVYEGTGLPGKANGISPRVLQEYQSLPDGPQKQALAKAMQLEAEGGGKPYSVVARGQMPTGPNQAQAAQDKGFAERYVKMYDTLLSTSDNERTKHQAYQQINSLLGQYEGGTMADTMLSIASEANRLGLPIDAKLSNKEAANAIRNQLMGEFKQMLPGPMSDADRKFLMSIPPSILNSSRGRQIMEEIQNRKATRASAEADMAAQYLQKYGTIDINFERSLNKWRRENRMFEGMSYGR